MVKMWLHSKIITYKSCTRSDKQYIHCYQCSSPPDIFSVWSVFRPGVGPPERAARPPIRNHRGQSCSAKQALLPIFHFCARRGRRAERRHIPGNNKHHPCHPTAAKHTHWARSGEDGGRGERWRTSSKWARGGGSSGRSQGGQPAAAHQTGDDTNLGCFQCNGNDVPAYI